MNFDIVQGDIAAQSADALVNAANTGMRMGTGVSGALREAGGDALDEEAVANGPVDLGGVVVTDAYDLDAEYVLHAATMTPQGAASRESIRDATRNALGRADELGCASLVIPVLGTGSGGFSTAEGARTIARVLAAARPDRLETVRLIAHGDDTYRTVRRVCDDVRNV
jgi:O-acetyl-ADP-ribose deacetylase (regulator of RNase III)